jgi:adenine-specific DNA-methyltransferase
VLGEDNFLSSIIHQRAKGGGMAKNFVKAHDYIHVYAKNSEKVDIKQNKVIQQKTIEKNGRQYIINNDIFRRGFGRKDRSAEHRCYFYEELIEIDTYKDDVKDGVASGRYILQEYKPGKHLVARYEAVDESFSKVYTIQKYLSEQGKIAVDELMGENIFDFSKPVDLVDFLIHISTHGAKDGIILDFFSGSGTTAHAVMQLNAEDGGNRKWIMVQLPEETDEKSEAFKAGYKTIPEISRERIRRAGDKIATEHPEAKVDYGFRSLVIAETNYKEVYKPAGELQQSALLDVVDNIKEDRSELDLLFGVLTASALELNRPLETRDVSGATVYLYDYLAESSAAPCW